MRVKVKVDGTDFNTYKIKQHFEQNRLMNEVTPSEVLRGGEKSEDYIS